MLVAEQLQGHYLIGLIYKTFVGFPIARAPVTPGSPRRYGYSTQVE